MKHSLALLLCSWLVPTLMLGSCGSTRSVELVGGELAEVTSSFLASLDADQQKAAQRAIDHEGGATARRAPAACRQGPPARASSAAAAAR